MADQASSTITIDAPADAVLEVIGDIASYPEWTGQIRSAEVVETDAAGRPARATFVMDAGVLKDTYTLRYAWADAGVSWELDGTSTVQKSQQGSYTLADRDGRTEVTYHLSVDLTLPMLGMFKRKAEKMIMDTALKELKKRVESTR